MKYRELGIRTSRGSPVRARSAAAALLTRAGYLTSEGETTALGDRALVRLKDMATTSAGFLSELGLEVHSVAESEMVCKCAEGDTELLECMVCGYAAAAELAKYRYPRSHREPALPLQRIPTPDCSTINALATFLGIPRNKTAKALMHVRPLDGQFVFVVVGGDRQISKRKLEGLVGILEPAGPEQISSSGAVAGYASPVGLRGALVVVDEQIVESTNLVGGANEAGYHLQNMNYGRDFQADLVGDLTLASPGDGCPNCGNPLVAARAFVLADKDGFNFQNMLLALADKYHDERGLCLPSAAAPFDVHLVHLASKEVDTAGPAEQLYRTLEASELSVLYDDRNERAGVKFNDADLIGLPMRVTVGAKGLANRMIEFKARSADHVQLVPLQDVAHVLGARTPRA
jgi:prolyl-tRNA synthetase